MEDTKRRPKCVSEAFVLIRKPAWVATTNRVDMHVSVCVHWHISFHSVEAVECNFVATLKYAHFEDFPKGFICSHLVRGTHPHHSTTARFCKCTKLENIERSMIKALHQQQQSTGVIKKNSLHLHEACERVCLRCNMCVYVCVPLVEKDHWGRIFFIINHNKLVVAGDGSTTITTTTHKRRAQRQMNHYIDRLVRI